MRHSPALAGALLLVAVVITVNVYALSQSTVRSATTVSVVSSDAALLALSENHFMSSIVNGQLQINFQLGRNSSGTYGLRSDATYPDEFKMYDIFRVTNNSDVMQCVQVKTTAAAPAHLFGIYGRLSGSSPPGVSVSGASAFTLNPGQTMIVDFTWRATTPVNAGAFALQVTGQKLVSCP